MFGWCKSVWIHFFFWVEPCILSNAELISWQNVRLQKIMLTSFFLPYCSAAVLEPWLLFFFSFFFSPLLRQFFFFFFIRFALDYPLYQITMPVSSGTNEIHIESIEIEGSQPFTFIRGDPSTPVIETPPNPVNASYNLESAAVTVATKIKNENKLEREKLLSMQKMMASFLQGALQDKREVSSYHAL